MTHGERVLIAADTWLGRKRRPCPVSHLCHVAELRKDKVKTLLISLEAQGRCTLGKCPKGGMAVVNVAQCACSAPTQEIERV